jgi:hypothetical protein
MKATLVVLMMLALVASVAAEAAGNREKDRDMAPRAKFHLYLLIGQSNMAGRGKVTAGDREPHPHVLALNKKDEWVPAVDPLHFDKPGAGVGPGLAFGRAMADADPSAHIGLIPCACGGSPITVWKKGAFWRQTRSHPYDDTLRRVAVARKRGVLKAILWHQGEGDSNAKAAPLYAERLDDLVKRLRRDLHAPDVPFLVGGLSDPFIERNTHARTVDKALRSLPRRVEHTAYVSAEGLGLKGDNVHFNAEAARDLGRRYAKALLELRREGSARQKPEKP